MDAGNHPRNHGGIEAMKEPKPRRKNKTHAEQEADLKAKLAALDAKRIANTRKQLKALSDDAEKIDMAGVPANVTVDLSTAVQTIDAWLAAGKPGAG